MNNPSATSPQQPNKSNSIDVYAQELKSSDAAHRRRAIIGLGKSGDLAALKPLGEVFHKDPSVELRELARQAGVHIRQQAEKGVEHPPVEQAKKRKVTEADLLRAKGYTEQALTFSLEGDNARAVKSLYNALLYNPALATDTYFTGIAASLLDVPPSEAITLLKDAEQRGDFARATESSRRSAKAEQHMDEARRFTWAGVSLELGLYLLISAFGPVLLIMAAIQSVQQLTAQGPTASEGMPGFVTQFETVVSAGVSYPALLSLALISAVGGLVNLLAQTGLIHLIARGLLHGKGTFAYLLSKVVPLLARYLLIMFVVSSLAVGIGIGVGMFFLVYIAGFGLILFSLLTLLKLAGQIGKAYHTSTGVGCASLLLSAIALAVINGIMSSLLSQTLAALLSGSVTPT